MNIKSGMSFSPEMLAAPSGEFNVCYSWTWNAPVTKEGIDERLSGFVKAGIKCLYILPLPKDFRPERLRTFLDPEYLTENFFELVDYALHRASDLGIEAWIYDEGGWPSGGACYHTIRENPDATMKVLESREVHFESDERFKPEEGFIALFDGKRRLTDDYISARSFTATAYYAVPKPDHGNRVDNTCASVTDTFINNTYEAYKSCVGDMFGDALPLFFTDEPGLFRNALAYNEFELFEKEYGYDLRDYIYVLEGGGEEAITEKEIQARIDHFTLVGKLFRENTCEKLEAWCEKNGVYYAGHLDVDNRPWGGMAKGYFSHTDLLRHFHVPGIDVIWEQIRYPYGGRAPLDDETLGYGFFPRLAPSAARQAGRNVSLTESLGIYGDGLTPDDIRYVINYQMIRGINAINFAPISFGSSRMSALMSRPNFRPEKPGFYNLKHINDYYAGLSYLCRLGEAEIDAALYHPCRDYAGTPGDLDEASVSFKELGTALEEKNIAFDIIDDNAILAATDTGDGLKIGDALYRHIAVPKNKYMPEAVKKKIAPYIGEGAPIYTPKCDKLRFMTRKVDNSRLWFVFNEGEPTVTEELDIAGEKKLYRIDLACGEMYREAVAKPTLLCGDIAVYLVTDEEYETATQTVTDSVEIDGFKAQRYDRFTIEYYGIHNEHHDGVPTVTEDFSGTVYYTADYELKEAPKAKDRYRIALEGFSVSAEVKLDGKYACDLGMSPMQAIIPAGLLKKRGKIEIAVSNTAANELVSKREFIKNTFPMAEIGAYAMGKSGSMPTFEERRAPLLFGKVKIEKLG